MNNKDTDKSRATKEKTEYSDLLPCPFCDGDAEFFEGMTSCYCECVECGAQGEHFPIYADRHGIDNAKNAWNTRVSSALLPGDSRKPKFGELLRGIWASKDNPQRDGMYVETKHRKGTVNNGTFYRITNGKGKFWEYEPKDTMYLGREEKKVEDEGEGNECYS